MATRTLTALYDTKDGAERAKDKLKAAGVDNIDIHDQGAADIARTAGEKTRGLLDRIADFFGGHHEDAHAYAEGVRRGHYLLTAKVDEANADAAARSLGASGAIDFDQAQAGWRAEGWAPGQRAYDQGASVTAAGDTRRIAGVYEQSASTPLGPSSAAPTAGTAAESFGEPASTGSQVAPELPAQTTTGAAVETTAAAPKFGSALFGDQALERVTDGGSITKSARREDERSNAFVRSYVTDEAKADYTPSAADDTAGEALLRQDTADVFEPRMQAGKDLDQGIPRNYISPGGSLNRPA